MICTNKHVVVAMLVAPVLAIMAWFGVDYFLSERPHAAVEGGTYLLIARSNCRYDSGECDLVNGDFKLTLKPLADVSGPVTLEMTSKFPLQAATLGLVDGGTEQEPAAMQRDSETRWLWALQADRSADSFIRLAVVASETTYYAEVPLTFMEGAR